GVEVGVTNRLAGALDRVGDRIADAARVEIHHLTRSFHHACCEHALVLDQLGALRHRLLLPTTLAYDHQRTTADPHHVAANGRQLRPVRLSASRRDRCLGGARTKVTGELGGMQDAGCARTAHHKGLWSAGRSAGGRYLAESSELERCGEESRRVWRDRDGN